MTEKKNIDFSQVLIFDGAMGTMLQKKGLCAGEIPEVYNITQPEIIESIHREYLEAGCDIITTNTFGANKSKLEKSGYSVEEIITAGVNIAKKAVDGKVDKYIALNISSIGQLMEPYGMLSFDNAYKMFAEEVVAGDAAGADFIIIETMSDIYELKAAILAAKENSQLPIIASMTFQQDGRTLTGTDPVTMVNVLEGLGVAALGVNCSLGPVELLPIVKEIIKYAQIPIIVQPNAGLPKLVAGNTIYEIEEEVFAKYAALYLELGVNILGGCCGTEPSHISFMKKAINKSKLGKREVNCFTAVSSGVQTIVFENGAKIIGERINPTGKKKLKEALKTENLEYILSEAIYQKEAGAHILDVNVGLPEIDEKMMMVKTIKEIQSIINLPLQIDSTNAEVIEAGVRYYNGKPLINSVNGKKESMDTIFPIAKKYGACVLGLTLDEEGIPASAEERLKIAEKILNVAKSYGIKKEDILIDCLVLTVSAQQSEVKETIKAVKLVKEKLGLKTVLGISNVSFGLPNRAVLNKTFLALALGAGLDAPILNPLDTEMISTIDAFNTLWNYDKDSNEFIRKHGNIKSESKVNIIQNKNLKEVIIAGLKEEAIASTKELLKTHKPLEIIEEFLMPALDNVGNRYESGEIFLPQLIQSAETVKKSFEIIKSELTAIEKTDINKGTIVLATVKGDIHDIGKNIVKILLQNYGFEIIDLGKDVDIDLIVKTVKEKNIKLVGLSALMTTTVVNMAETIKALRKENLDCKVFVGGAVLNPEYAKMIEADYYAKDARESVIIAQEFFEK